ncbi:DUF624 domain-containing protein [Enterococcus casseliflavus]|uniref:DUF624 domain-containing protein n=1 Tax=Enterococcus TaxID=1350 RepID=UPI00232EFC95|nr:DUF624 domain-containing protein [Enterococcus casseliflavus]MDB1694149.1 DUF624 domain-containing protein [Enterococcus casseliflavus]MDB1697082.1 DUF624 domain-containing protein [Enterococcus casseliflavus]MDB1701521.1 DUF624 domain-containing protein [Enterococcus casseliflavus]MDB1704756.1 DUF624 domain-containing protein [Enterococcus casseliflavus]
MIHFFHSENFFARIAWKFSQLLLLNVLLLFFSLPLFTIGAAITAGSKVATDLIEGKAPAVVQQFWSTFCQSFRKSTLIWLGLLISLWLLTADWLYYFQLKGTPDLFTVGLVICTFMWLQFFQVSFFLLARYDSEIKTILLNSIKVAAKHPFKILSLHLLTAAPIVIMLLSPYALVFSMYIACFFGLSCFLYVRCQLLLAIFKKYEKVEIAEK